MEMHLFNNDLQMHLWCATYTEALDTAVVMFWCQRTCTAVISTQACVELLLGTACFISTICNPVSGRSLGIDAGSEEESPHDGRAVEGKAQRGSLQCHIAGMRRYDAIYIHNMLRGVSPELHSHVTDHNENSRFREICDATLFLKPESWQMKE